MEYDGTGDLMEMIGKYRLTNRVISWDLTKLVLWLWPMGMKD